MKPKILVTGASGFSGSHLLRYLHEQGYEVYGHHGRSQSDLADPWNVKRLQRHVHVICHLAACSPWAGVPLQSIAKNVDATINLIDYARKVGVEKIIYFSSTSLYGTVKGGLLTENSPRINPDVYGQTKSICEALLQESQIPTVSLRLPGIVGKGARRNWLSQVMQSGNRGEPIEVFNAEGWYNNSVHVEFLCQLVERLFTTERWHEIFTPILVASKGTMTIREVVRAVVPEPRHIREKEFTSKESWLIDVNRLATILEPWTIQETVRKYVEDEALEKAA